MHPAEARLLEDPRYQQCVAFHGHSCGGLTIGFKASLYAMELLGLTGHSEDEEVVCITENDACGVDAIQALLSCTFGKGNLLYKPRGKQAFSFYRRDNGQSVRLLLRRGPGETREERSAWLMATDYHDLFDVQETRDALPETARLFRSVSCSHCGEICAERYAHLLGGEVVCEDCFPAYQRIL